MFCFPTYSSLLASRKLLQANSRKETCFLTSMFHPVLNRIATQHSKHTVPLLTVKNHSGVQLWAGKIGAICGITNAAKKASRWLWIERTNLDLGCKLGLGESRPGRLCNVACCWKTWDPQWPQEHHWGYHHSVG